MIRLQLRELDMVDDAQDMLPHVRQMLQAAIGVEFGTLPPYLYALYSIPTGTNKQAEAAIKSVALEEMVHMCLVCNILNAIGGSPIICPQTYPNPLPGDIGPDGTPLTLHLYPFSKEAMQQAMYIEEPENPPDFPEETLMAVEPAARAVTIGQFYRALDGLLEKLPASVWHSSRNQLDDSQFLQGQIFAVNNYDDAHSAIEDIISEGEGSRQGTEYQPLDFQGELSHFFRFGELFHDFVLTRILQPPGYEWGPSRLGVDWDGIYPAIIDPGHHDFSKEPSAAQEAQEACNQAFTTMVDALQEAVRGQAAALGQAVQAMFHLRLSARRAFTTPLADGARVAGPAFLYLHGQNGGVK